MSKILHKKINRLYDGFSPRTLDMFCGAGGLSLGFHRADYEIISAVEIDTFAAAGM